MSTVTKKHTLSNADINEYIRQLSAKHPNVENQDFSTIASLISSEFEVDCTEKDIARVFEEDFQEDYERDSRIVENQIYDF
jgi:cell division protein YceG involved in septum cleavage